MGHQQPVGDSGGQVLRGQWRVAAVGPLGYFACPQGRLLEMQGLGLVDGNQFDIAGANQFAYRGVARRANPEHRIDLALQHGKVRRAKGHGQGGEIILTDTVMVRHEPEGCELGAGLGGNRHPPAAQLGKMFDACIGAHHQVVGVGIEQRDAQSLLGQRHVRLGHGQVHLAGFQQRHILDAAAGLEHLDGEVGIRLPQFLGDRLRQPIGLTAPGARGQGQLGALTATQPEHQGGDSGQPEDNDEDETKAEISKHAGRVPGQKMR